MFRLCLLNETLNVLFSSEVRTLVASLTEILVNGAHAPPSRPDPLATEADLGGVGEKLVRHCWIFLTAFWKVNMGQF